MGWLSKFTTLYYTFLAISRKVSVAGFSSLVNQNKKRKLSKDRELNFLSFAWVG